MNRIQDKKIRNPWMGLASYDEPDSENEAYLFCGREQATKEVVSMIDNNLFLLLYGGTGVGKTSLLKAGVFPVMRQRNYLPLYIRLGLYDSDKSFEEAIVESVQIEMERCSCKIDTKQVLDSRDDDYLWKFFCSSMFYNSRGEVVYPLIVLDQFEEIFIRRREDAWSLMTHIYKLIDDTPIIDMSKGYHSETNFRFVASIREDYLYNLEECIDAQHLTEMLFCRFRLASMNFKEASSVVLLPGEGLINPSDEDLIVDRIINIATTENNSGISSLLLSLACSQLFYIASNQGDSCIRARHLDYLNDNPLADLYKNAKLNLTRRQISFIESNFIDCEGKRTSVLKQRFDAIISGRKDLFSGDLRIFNIIKISDDVTRVELLHDLLAKAVHEERQRRSRITEFFRQATFNGILYGVTMSLGVFLCIANWMHTPILWLIVLTYIVSTCVVSIGQMYKDIKLEAGLLPHVFSTLALYFTLGEINMHAYRTIGPDIMEILLLLFLMFNMLIFLINVVRLTAYRKDFSNRCGWRDFFSIKREMLSPTNVLYFSVFLGIVLVLSILHFTPKTQVEIWREEASFGDAEANYQLGEYYMDYWPNVEKAREYYQKAVELGHDEAGMRVKDIRKEYNRKRYGLSKEMQMNAMKALIYSAEKRDTVVSFADIDTLVDYKTRYSLNRLLYGNLHEILEYNETYDTEMYLKWSSFYGNVADIGYHFWRGDYVDQDLTRAFELYMEAGSHFNVIQCYLNGWGVERSRSKAYEYYKGLDTDIYGAYSVFFWPEKFLELF